MHPAPLIDTLMALRELPEALLQSLPPVRRAQRLSQLAGVAARRAVWYSALATLTLLTPPERGSAQFNTVPKTGNAPLPEPLSEGGSTPQTWAATLLVLAVIGVQIAQRRERHPFTS